MEQRLAEKKEAAPELLPLVIEIIPGQAAEGLIDIYEVGSFEKKPLREIIENTLNKKDLTIEERLILEDIKRQLDGGILLCRGGLVQGTAIDHAVIQETEKGERYYYVAVRAIKPQEGGFSSGMEKKQRKKWDPNCPKCQEEVRRRLELLDSVFEDVDHGLIGRRLMEEDFYSGHCDHEEGKDE